MPIYKQRQELTQVFKNQSQSHDIWEDMSTLLIPFSIIYKPFQFLFLITRDVLTYLFENCFQKKEEKTWNPSKPKQIGTSLYSLWDTGNFLLLC